ncbi:MAG: hypothetical protein AAGG51_23030 [Cyanobacteria bacterium P01_G01_bin.54]
MAEKIKHDRYVENKVNAGYALTPTAKRMLKDVASKHGVSVSELIERIARGELQVGRIAFQTEKEFLGESLAGSPI